MRELLFRGQTRRKGEKVRMDGTPIDSNWVYGGVAQLNEERAMIYQTEPNFQKFAVYADTVGQYTGLTDKNGRKIFEGDIVKTQPFYDRPYPSKRKSKEFIGVVKYKTKIFNGNEYYSKQCYHGEWGLEFNEDFGEYTHHFWGELWNCEVIGNIHDNSLDDFCDGR